MALNGVCVKGTLIKCDGKTRGVFRNKAPLITYGAKEAREGV